MNRRKDTPFGKEKKDPNEMENRRFTSLDMLRLPFKACPRHTVLSLFNKLLNACIPSLRVLATAAFIDTALGIFQEKEEMLAIAFPLSALILLTAYTYLSWYAEAYTDIKLRMGLALKFRTAMTEKRARLRYEHIESSKSWDLIARLCKAPEEQLMEGYRSLTGGLDLIIRVGSLLLILLAQVWWAGLAILAVSVPLFWISMKAGKAGYEEDKKAKAFIRRSDYWQEVLLSRQGAEERTLFGYEAFAEKAWNEAFEESRKIQFRISAKYFIRIKASSLVTVLVSALIAFVLLFSLSKGEITSGIFIGLVTAAFDLVQAMSWQLGDSMQTFARNREYMKDLTSFFSLSETEDPLTLPAPAGSIPFESIECRNLSFRYPGTEAYILKDFSLRLEKGKHYAFVGINGAGKTTLTKLLTGLYDSFEGELLINGKDIRSYTQAELKSLFTVVYQDFARYEISMADTIGLGDAGSLEHGEGLLTAEKAAEKMGLSSLIERLPKGIRTPLGKTKEGGEGLSGGEWQKIAIARALCSPAQMQILDEPTAALDPSAESRLYELFGRISVGKSTIFITHRLGAAKLADEIVVIGGGKVLEKGSHEALMQLEGTYAEMFEAQRSWYE